MNTNTRTVTLQRNTLEVIVSFGQSDPMSLDTWCVDPLRAEWLTEELLRISRGEVLNNGNTILSLGYGEDVLHLTENDTPEQRSHAATLLIKLHNGEVEQYLEKVNDEIR